MRTRSHTYQLIGGVGTAMVVTAISGIVMWQKPLFVEAMVWQSLIVVAVFLVTNRQIEETKFYSRRVVLWLMLPLIFLLSWRVPTDVFFIYTVIWIACTPFFFSGKVCWVSLLLVNVAWYLLRSLVWPDSNPLIQTLLVGTFHVFALLSSTTAKEAEESNEKTQQLNRELLATQHLLGEASRNSERTRIARDLHDLLGHHLTALAINLQVAGRVTKGEVKEKIEECHTLSKLLLNDVRDAVETLRAMPIVDLRELLEITIRDIPRLHVTLDIEDDVQVDDVNTAEALLRLVQEAITNTLRHTSSKEAVIRVSKIHDQIELHYQDTGGGCEVYEAGNGLQGMRERVERLGGMLITESAPTFRICATLPLTM